MSYQVLARKWRPGKFSELVGQEHVVSAISNALDNDRLHHAYLFTGTRGVGKTTIARIFSKSLNCEEGQGANPCGQCNTCKEIEHGNYVDLLEIDAASRTKVEDTRELLDNVQYKPTRGRYKVYLIDEVHMLSKHSFNALLKTLEEPPPHVKFLLATTDPQKLPITILSRCLQFNLKALSREQIVGQLTHILQEESLPFEPSALALLARAAQGSMRDALSLTDQAIAQGGNAVNASVVTDMLGLMDKNQLVKLLHAVVTKTPTDVMQLVQDIAEQAPDYSQVLGELASTLHQIALTQWVPDVCKLETTSAKAIFQLAKSIAPEQVQLFYQIALQGRKDLPLALDGRSALEMTLMRMMTFAPNEPISDTEEIISTGKSQLNSPVSAITASEASSAVVAEKPAEESSSVSQRQASHSDEQSSLTPESETTLTQPVEPQPVELTPEESGAAPTQPEQAPSIDEPVTEAQSPALTPETLPPSDESPFNDTPPLDAYHDDLPPQETGMFDGEFGYQEPVHINEATEKNAAAEHLSDTSHGALQHGDNDAQLTSTADMLALRQKLKQQKVESAAESTKKAAKNDKDDGLFNRLSRGNGAQDITQAAQEPVAKENAPHTPDLGDDSPPWATESKGDDNPSSQSMAEPAQVEAPSRQVQTEEDLVTSQSHAPFAHESEPHANMPRNENNVDSQMSSDPLQPSEASDTGVAPQQYKGQLTAYLEDGKKLVHASQIDKWSYLVEQMPLAGLLKQLVLHASFSKNNGQVTLEIDNSQAHLLNESAKKQLLDALHHTLGEQVEIEIVLGNPAQTPYSLQQEIVAMREAYAHEVLESDEKIQALLSMFDASIVTDTVKAR